MRLIISILISLYLAIWIGSAFFYQYIANKTEGEAFVFQEDIRHGQRARLFLNSLNKPYIDENNHNARPSKYAKYCL